jgi:hypothetical protein
VAIFFFLVVIPARGAPSKGFAAMDTRGSTGLTGTWHERSQRCLSLIEIANNIYIYLGRSGGGRTVLDGRNAGCWRSSRKDDRSGDAEVRSVPR